MKNFLRILSIIIISSLMLLGCGSNSTKPNINKDSNSINNSNEENNKIEKNNSNNKNSSKTNQSIQQISNIWTRISNNIPNSTKSLSSNRTNSRNWSHSTLYILWRKFSSNNNDKYSNNIKYIKI